MSDCLLQCYFNLEDRGVTRINFTGDPLPLEKMKYFFLILLLIFVAALLILKFAYAKSGSELGHLSNVIFNNNTLELNCTGIDRKDVDVIWEPEEARADTALVISGIPIHKPGYVYGGNTFIIRADGKRFECGYFKERNWDPYDYRIDVSKTTAGYTIGFFADGAQYEHEEIPYNSAGQLNGWLTRYDRNGNSISRDEFKDGIRVK